jgi:hypothetical protein
VNTAGGLGDPRCELDSTLKRKTPEAPLAAIPAFAATVLGWSAAIPRGAWKTPSHKLLVTDRRVFRLGHLNGDTIGLRAPLRLHSHGSHSGEPLLWAARERAMSAVANGLVVSNIGPYESTFLVFSDYARRTIWTTAPCRRIRVHDCRSRECRGATDLTSSARARCKPRAHGT